MNINKILWIIYGILFLFMFFLTILYYDYSEDIVFYTILIVSLILLLDYTCIYINKKHNQQ